MVSRKYDILKLLYDNNGRIDVDVLMNELTKDVPEAEKFDAKQRLSGTITDMMHRDNGFLREWVFSTKAEFAIRYINRARRTFYDNELIPVEISEKGLEEYHKLTKLYSPDPPEPAIVNYHQTTYGSNSPIAGRDQTTGDITINDESKETKELSKELLKDLPKTKWYRRWGLILLILAIIAAIVIAIIQGMPKK